MHNKLETSVKSLTAWVDKILVDSKGTEWRLRNFSDAYNITDFQKFYNELLPHVTRLKMEDSDLFEKLATTFEQNSKKLSEAMEERFSTLFFGAFPSSCLFWDVRLPI